MTEREDDWAAQWWRSQYMTPEKADRVAAETDREEILDFWLTLLWFSQIVAFIGVALTGYDFIAHLFWAIVACIPATSGYLIHITFHWVTRGWKLLTKKPPALHP